MSATISQPATMNAAELAALLRISLPTLRKKREGGMIPTPILGGRYPLWSREQVEKWLRGEGR